MRAAGLHDVSEFLGLGEQRLVEDLETRDEGVDGGLSRCDVGGGRERVVGGLAHVDVVVRVNLDAVVVSDRRDDLVGVHVGRGAGTGLEDVDGESIVVLVLTNFLGGGDNRVGLLGVELAGVLVDLCARSLEQAKGADLGSLEAAAGDGEVIHCALGLGAPQRVNRDLYFAHGVVFDAVLSHECSTFLSST